MPQLMINFAPARRQPNVLGWLVLCIGVAFAGWVYSDYDQLLAKVSARDLRMAAQPSRPQRAQIDPETQQVVLEMQRRLATPWNTLLSQIEATIAASEKQIALLEIMPNREGGKLTIVAEAKTLQASLDFVTRLQGNSALTNPILVNHEIQTRERERPVRFEVQAGWRVEV